jgi:hypothetical protein
MIKKSELIFAIKKYFQTFTISKNLSFTNEINEYLPSLLKNYNFYLEYGSGSSTVFFANNTALNIVSVESDIVYAKSVIKSIHKNREKINILPAKIGLTGFWGYPIFYKKNKNKGWKYVNTPWRIIGENYKPEIVLIDGRYRVACALNILLKAANKYSVLIIIDDYVGREEYYIFEKFLKVSKSIDRMAFFEYNKELINNEQINAIKETLDIYLNKVN